MKDPKKWLLAQAKKHADLAKKYRASLARAEAIGVPWPDGSFRGPYGNARDPERGWHYSPRIRKEAIRHELMAKTLRQAAKAVAS